MTRRKTHEQYAREVYLINPYTKIIEKYVDAKTKIRHLCRCGESWDIEPSRFISRAKSGFDGNCPKCGSIKNTRKRTKTHSKFTKEVEAILGNSYKILGEYVNSQTIVEMLHIECGTKYSVIPNNIISYSSGCPMCSGKLMDTKQYKSKVYDLVGNEYTIIGKYIKSKYKIKTRHNKCGYEYLVSPDSFIRSESRCPKCQNVLRRNTTSFSNEIELLTNGEYEVLGQYINSDTKISIRHNKCGESWSVVPYSFTGNGTRCPNCTKSKAENALIELLKVLYKPYNTNKRYSQCKNKLPLPFDILVDKTLLIECDGKQHFESVEFFGGEESFEYRKKNDQIKNQYCIDNNIPLIRIPYWEFDNIEYILDNVLKYFNIIDGECEDPSIVEKYYVREGWNQGNYINSFKSIDKCNK